MQNDKDQQAVTAAKQEQAKLEELAKNAEAEKAKAEKNKQQKKLNWLKTERRSQS